MSRLNALRARFPAPVQPTTPQADAPTGSRKRRADAPCDADSGACDKRRRLSLLSGTEPPLANQPALRLAHLDQLLSQPERPTQRLRRRGVQTLQQLLGMGAAAAAAWIGARVLAESPAAAAMSNLGASSLGHALGAHLSSFLSDLRYGDRAATEADQRRSGVLLQLQAETREQQPPLMPATLKAIQALDTTIEARRHNPECGEVLLRRRESILRCVPTQVVDVSHQHVAGDPAKRRAIDARVEALVSEYGPEHAATLRAFIGQLRANCFTQSPSRAQLYLQGQPGTGKTRFVRRLAEALGLPMVTIQCTKDSKLLAQRTSAYDLERKDTDDAKLVGEVGAALLQAGCLNPIVFVDEASDFLEDFEFRQALKLLLDPDRKVLTWEAFGGLNVDFSRATVIMAGNGELKDEALRTRMPQVVFGALPRHHKNTVLRAHIAELLLDNAVLPPRVAKCVAKSMQGAQEIILDLDAERGVEGVRTAQEVARRVMSGLRDAALRNVRLSSEAVRDLAATAFDGYCAAPPA